MEQPLVTNQQINKYTGRHFDDCIICGKETNQYYNGIPYCASHLYDILNDESDLEEGFNQEIQTDPEMENRLNEIMAKREVLLYDIRVYVCNKVSEKYYKINPEDIDKKTRKREIVFARQLCMSIARLATKHSRAVIGFDYGNKNHATVLHAEKTIDNIFDTDKELKSIIANCMSRFNVYDKFLDR